MRAAGFNTLRLPFSLAMLDAAAPTGIDCSAGKNGPLRGRTPLEALDAIIDAAAEDDLLILLDCPAFPGVGRSWSALMRESVA